MLIYYHASDDKDPVASHTILIAPAGHLPQEYTGDSWWDKSGERPRPVQFEVHFRFGQAETTDEIGRYMVKTGQAHKTRLIRPNQWTQ